MSATTTVIVKTTFGADSTCTVAALRDFLRRWDAEVSGHTSQAAADAEQSPVRVSLGIFGLAAITSIQAEVPVEQG